MHYYIQSMMIVLMLTSCSVQSTQTFFRISYKTAVLATPIIAAGCIGLTLILYRSRNKPLEKYNYSDSCIVGCPLLVSLISGVAAFYLVDNLQ